MPRSSGYRGEALIPLCGQSEGLLFELFGVVSVLPLLGHLGLLPLRSLLEALLLVYRLGEGPVRVIYKITSDPVTPDQRSTGLQHCWGRDLTDACEHLPARGVGQVV